MDQNIALPNLISVHVHPQKVGILQKSVKQNTHRKLQAANKSQLLFLTIMKLESHLAVTKLIIAFHAINLSIYKQATNLLHKCCKRTIP